MRGLKSKEQIETERLEKRQAELERMLHQKQMEIDFNEKMIEIASEQIGIDLKGKFGSKPQ
jgi:transposase